ncbi:hypothetical protein HMI54_015206 [Coelomomyces lativittatus]|nr:hypothetical protein HMI56_007215 [Coelomomyces lativittatus]KAJ1513134.1 hypothetical protein HMI54_015206 [Coelomomyces lativittatus]
MPTETSSKPSSSSYHSLLDSSKSLQELTTSLLSTSIRIDSRSGGLPMSTPRSILSSSSSFKPTDSYPSYPTSLPPSPSYPPPCPNPPFPSPSTSFTDPASYVSTSLVQRHLAFNQDLLTSPYVSPTTSPFLAPKTSLSISVDCFEVLEDTSSSQPTTPSTPCMFQFQLDGISTKNGSL